MDFYKVRKIEDTIAKNRQKLMKEKDSKKKDILRIKIGIDELRVKLERTK
jgi:hypothetical protein